ncbi:MAG: S41 family peptidase [Bacteroidales bacterium]|nr:S41 family peptidase [Bacteroidales bacterium]
MKKKILIAIIFIIAISWSFKIFDDGDDFELIKNLEIYHNVMKQLRINYVEEIDSRYLITLSINDMLKDLDPYTIYYSESQIESFKLMSQSQSIGTGLTIDTLNSKTVIVDIKENSSAAKNGLLPGDIIANINGINTEFESLTTLNNMLAGQVGTKVAIKYERNGTVASVNLVRELIQEHVVSLVKNIDNIGYIKLESFTDKSASEFQQAFLDLKTQGITGLIIDLRGNPGGLLDQAVKIVNLFIPKDKLVVTSKGNSVNSNSNFMTQQNPIDEEIPIVVLINNRSASASEIVAGTLQDYDRAVIMGEQSFGKGLVQRFFDVGYNSQMKITISKYYIPSGRCIQQINYSKTSNTINTNTKFYTASGRIVYEGNGILPDIAINRDTMPAIINFLIDNKIIFQYANQYFNSIDTSQIPKPQDIKFNEINSFVDFITSNNFLENTIELKNLNKISTTFSTDQTILAQTNQLKTNIYNNFISEIKNNTHIINILTSKEIAKRKYFHTGLVEYDLNVDTEIKQAKLVLQNTTKYSNLLSPQ